MGNSNASTKSGHSTTAVARKPTSDAIKPHLSGTIEAIKAESSTVTRRASFGRQTSAPLSSSMDPRKINLPISRMSSHANLIALLLQPPKSGRGSKIDRNISDCFPTNIWLHILRKLSLPELHKLTRVNKSLFCLVFQTYTAVAKRIAFSSDMVPSIKVKVQTSCDAEFLSSGSVVVIFDHTAEVAWNVYDHRFTRKSRVSFFISSGNLLVSFLNDADAVNSLPVHIDWYIFTRFKSNNISPTRP